VSYRVHIPNRVRDRLASWNLPPAVFVDVGLRLEDLGERPADRLVRIEAPFQGLGYWFSVIDPDNRLAEYRFLFHVIYGQDEATLHVVSGACQVAFGW
jgi:hypothetical protein